MKIYEIVVGNAGPETVALKPPERERIPHRRVQRPPQPGYFVKLGNKAIPSPLDQSDNELGVVNSVIGG